MSSGTTPWRLDATCGRERARNNPARAERAGGADSLREGIAELNRPGTSEFDAWFGESKMVDKNGLPRAMLPHFQALKRKPRLEAPDRMSVQSLDSPDEP